jgi:lipopolysaccharide export LptBFGC system permease protein LptF
VTALLLALLAIPLGYVNPRVGRSANLIIAVLVFLTYHNGMSIVQAWVQQERLSFGVGIWLTHAVAGGLIGVLFTRRVYLQRWLPRWIWRDAAEQPVKTLRRYLTRELVRATGVVLFALLALFAFFDLLSQVDDLRPGGYSMPRRWPTWRCRCRRAPTS